MTLLTALFAAIICTVVWYTHPDSHMKLGVLCGLFWGASISWFVDGCFAYAEQHADFFRPAPADMLNDLYLGLSVVALAMLIWLAVLLISDPRGVVRAALHRKK